MLRPAPRRGTAASATARANSAQKVLRARIVGARGPRGGRTGAKRSSCGVLLSGMNTVYARRGETASGSDRPVAREMGEERIARDVRFRRRPGPASDIEERSESEASRPDAVEFTIVDDQRRAEARELRPGTRHDVATCDAIQLGQQHDAGLHAREPAHVVEPAVEEESRAAADRERMSGRISEIGHPLPVAVARAIEHSVVAEPDPVDGAQLDQGWPVQRLVEAEAAQDEEKVPDDDGRGAGPLRLREPGAAARPRSPGRWTS